MRIAGTRLLLLTLALGCALSVHAQEVRGTADYLARMDADKDGRDDSVVVNVLMRKYLGDALTLGVVPSNRLPE